MKHKKQIYSVILVFATLLGIWVLPSFLKKATDSPDHYPFVYYSSVLKELGIVDYKEKKTPLTDMKGNKYTTAQFDSLMPLLNYRQLMSDGRLPDSLGSYKLTPQLLKSKSVVFRHAPSDLQTPVMGLYILFESMPKRVGLEIPGDVFRLGSTIEFTDMETNTVDAAKSELFRKELDKAGYSFPAQWAAGNPNPRKPYDEGYFSLDAKGNLFHIKMVNGRPFVRNTLVSNEIDIAHFVMLEVSDKRFYGFLFSKQGDIYIIEGNEGKYLPVKLDLPAINLATDQVNILGNLLYWTVWVTTPQGRFYYGLDSQTLKKVGEYKVDREENKWDKVSRWIFPCYLTFHSSDSDYLYPRIHITGVCGFVTNIVLALLACLFLFRTRERRISGGLYIALTGLAGLVAILLLPNFRKSDKK